MAAILMSCSCGVKFETGQTTEEAQTSSKITANKIKSDWAMLINGSSPREVGFHFKTYLDNISNNYIEYGFRLTEKWREGNDGRGEAIPANEMRSVIKSWIIRDKPILIAWEDNIDYARNRMIEDGFYSPETMSLFDYMIDQFNEVYNAVLFPNGDVDNYEDQLFVIKAETDNLSKKLEIELD